MSVAEIACALFGHKLRIVKRYSATERKVYCCRCHGLFGMHDGVQAFVDWDGQLAELHGEDWP